MVNVYFEIFLKSKFVLKNKMEGVLIYRKKNRAS
jgi:hypothetical protein